KEFVRCSFESYPGSKGKKECVDAPSLVLALYQAAFGSGHLDASIRLCWSVAHWLTAGCPKSAVMNLAGLSSSIAARIAEGATCAYLIVMTIVECPRSACTIFRGTPFM